MATDDNGQVEGLLEQVQRKKAERAGIAPPRARGGGLLAQVQRKIRDRLGFPSLEPMAQPTAAGAGRPSSKAFWAAYLNYDAIPPAKNAEVWKKVGGWVGRKYGDPPQNSCATRVSYGLNYGGAPIPSTAPGALLNDRRVVFAGRKGDDKYYIVNVGNLNAHFSRAWGPPDHRQVATVAELETIIGALAEGQCAIFATSKSPGHSGVLKKGYDDPYVKAELPLDLWKLPVP